MEKRQPWKYTPEYKERFISLWQSDRTLQEIADELQLGTLRVSTLAWEFRKQGVLLRKRSAGKHACKVVPGQQYGRLTVLHRVANKGRLVLFECLCVCGQKTITESFRLQHGATQSCGCMRQRVGKDNPNWQGYGEISQGYWHQVIIGAENRQLALGITIEDAWNKFEAQQGKCALSGVQLNFRDMSRNSSSQTASLDRIDSMKGYTLDNIQWIHKDLQWLKGTFTQDEFLLWVHIIASHHKMKIEDNLEAPKTSRSSRWMVNRTRAA